MAKATRYGFKDVLTGKLHIPKADEEFDKDSDMGKNMLNAIELNKVAYTELLLSIDAKTSNGKITFSIVKGWKRKGHLNDNSAMAWENLKNKYKPMSAPSMVKLDQHSGLKKGEDPEVWITQLEDICVSLEDMGSGISERQFMIHVLNNLMLNYDLQVALLERRIGDAEHPLTVSEIRAKLSLRFKSLNKNAKKDNGDNSEEMAFYGGQFKGKC